MIGTALRLFFGWLTSGPLDRILSTVDKKIKADTDKEALKAEIVKTWLTTRADYMRAGGFWLMLIFAVPLAVHFAAVIFYGLFWCAGCAFPQDWTIAALPPPLDEWAGLIVVSIFGVQAVTRLRR
jgi:hypothetical protein